jgi:hypothetical protein
MLKMKYSDLIKPCCLTGTLLEYILPGDESGITKTNINHTGDNYPVSFVFPHGAEDNYLVSFVFPHGAGDNYPVSFVFPHDAEDNYPVSFFFRMMRETFRLCHTFLPVHKTKPRKV